MAVYSSSGPSFWGINDIMVKAVKKAIYAVIGNADLTDEELMTVFTGAESLLNSQPLTYQSSDVRDILPLTPNHFFMDKRVVNWHQRWLKPRGFTQGSDGVKFSISCRWCGGNGWGNTCRR